MALDEAILEASSRGEAPPTLRLYAWRPPCLSLGIAQPVSDVLQSEIAARGWCLVRRPTGGRAILHADELTYSICGPKKELRLSGGVLKSYRTLSTALLCSLHLLGIPAQALDSKSNSNNSNPVCFEGASDYEISVGGKKLMGSAQARRRGGVLQHGSLPLYGDLTRIIQILRFPDNQVMGDASQRLLARATTAGSILGTPLDWDTAAHAFALGFSEALNLELKPGGLTPIEISRSEQLVEEKYANPDWTNRL